MRFLLTYDFCTRCLRREPWALEALGKIAMKDVVVSAVTVGQLMSSVLVVAKSKEDAETRMKGLKAFLAPIQVLPFGPAEAAEFAAAAAFLQGRGLDVIEAEVMVCATADAHGLTLVTVFGEVSSRLALQLEGVKQVDWSAPKGTTKQGERGAARGTRKS